MTGDVEVENAGGQAGNAAEDGDLRHLKIAFDLHIPDGVVEVLHAGVGVDVGRHAGVKADLFNGDELAAELGLEVETGPGDGHGLHAGAQVADTERDAVVVGLGDVVDVDAEVVGGEVKGDGLVVEEDDAVGELDLAGLQVEKGVENGFGRGRFGFWNGLVGAAVLVDDEVHLRLVDVQEREGDVLHRAGAVGGVGEEVLERDADEDAVGGDVGCLTRTFKTVDDEAVRFNGKVPQAEVHGGQVNLATGGFFQGADESFADAVLEVGGAGVHGEAAECEDEQQKKGAECPGGDAPCATPSGWRGGCLAGNGSLRGFWVEQAHQGASSPSFRMRTLPDSRRVLSHWSSRALTCCWSRSSSMRGARTSSAGGVACSLLYCGSMVFV